jgi:signal transduction histidine kinase
MSLTWRLLLVIVLLNLGVLAIVQWGSYSLQEGWLQVHRQFYGEAFESLVADAYSPELVSEDERRIRRLLNREQFRNMFKDVVLTNGRWPMPGFVNLNPNGALDRDPAVFPREEILRGLARAREERVGFEVAGGFCAPILAGDGVAGAIWYQPLVPSPELPIGLFAIPVLVSCLLFGFLAYWSIHRSVKLPIVRLGEAARSMGAGKYHARVPRFGAAGELNLLVDAFNAMAGKIEGHTEELSEKVREAVAEAERKERALVVSSRLAAMGTLAAGIAHEINNPIGGMLNAVHRLVQNPELSERDQTYLELVRDGLERVGRTTRRMLDFSPRQIRAERFQLRDAVEGARALVEHRLSAQGLRFDCRLEPDLPALVGDRHEIQQVLLNLFLNSLDAMGNRSGTISVRGLRDGDRVEILVADDGPGLGVEDVARVMDPFFSAKGQADASGLGMFISYSIVLNHGGEMEVDSAPGEGFRVRIRMPVGASDAAPSDSDGP